MQDLKVGLLESSQGAVVDARFRTTNADLKPGDVVKITNNLVVDKVANADEQAIGVVDGNWDALLDRVPVILQGFVYMDGAGKTLGAPFNKAITPIETLEGKIKKADGTESSTPMVMWVCA